MPANTAQMNTGTEPAAIGTIHLDVVDLEQSVEWWRDLVGLRVVSDDGEAVALGVDGKALVFLHPGATSRARRGYTGLYHLAISLPDEPALAHVLARLSALNAPFSGVDHIIAKSVYLSDPDGIGLELALETPERVAYVNWPETERAPEIIDAEGHSRESLGPLDLDAIQAVAPDAELSEAIAPGTRVGHVHLAVAELEPAYRFYHDTLDFARINYVPVIGYGDLGKSGTLLHQVALNTWQTAGAPPGPVGMAGMRRFAVRYGSQTGLSEAVERLEGFVRDGDGYLTHDPAGNEVELAAAAAPARSEPANESRTALGPAGALQC